MSTREMTKQEREAFFAALMNAQHCKNDLEGCGGLVPKSGGTCSRCGEETPPSAGK